MCSGSSNAAFGRHSSFPSFFPAYLRQLALSWVSKVIESESYWQMGQQSLYPENGVPEAISMARPVKWSRDLHPIRDRATRSKTETWSRQDIEQLFNVGRASAQTLMKAIGEVQEVGGTHFVHRASLLSFLDEMIQADSVEEALRSRQERASPIPRPKPLRISLPEDLRTSPSQIFLLTFT